MQLSVGDLAEVGYPIATIDRHGAFRLTKTPDSGGAVNRETVLEQLFYEIGDPAAYLTPDVVADFSQLISRKPPRMRCTFPARRGKPATPTYKASMAYRDGFTASGSLTLVGPGALAKARPVAT